MSCRTNPETIHNIENLKPISLYKKVQDKVCPICGKTYHPQREKQKYCSLNCTYEARKQSIGHAGLGIANENLKKENLLKLAKACNTIQELADRVGTSRPTIRKYLEKYGVLEEFKAKFDFRAKEIVQYDLYGHFIRN